MCDRSTPARNIAFTKSRRVNSRRFPRFASGWSSAQPRRAEDFRPLWSRPRTITIPWMRNENQTTIPARWFHRSIRFSVWLFGLLCSFVHRFFCRVKALHCFLGTVVPFIDKILVLQYAYTGNLRNVTNQYSKYRYYQKFRLVRNIFESKLTAECRTPSLTLTRRIWIINVTFYSYYYNIAFYYNIAVYYSYLTI